MLIDADIQSNLSQETDPGANKCGLIRKKNVTWGGSVRVVSGHRWSLNSESIKKRFDCRI